MSEWHLSRWADLPPWREPPKADAVGPETIWTNDEIMASAARVPWLARKGWCPESQTAEAAYQRRVWWLQRKRDMGW